MMATTEEVAALKRRLASRQAQRRLDADTDEVIRMVQRRKPQPEPAPPVRPAERSQLVRRPEPLGRSITAAAIATMLARAVCDNALFLLVLGFAVFAAAQVA